MKKLFYPLAFAALLLPSLASASVIAQQTQVPAFFVYGGVSSGGAYAVSDSFTIPPSTTISDVQIIVVSVASTATSTYALVSCDTGSIAAWTFDLASLSATTSAAYLLTGSINGRASSIPTFVTPAATSTCTMQFVAGVYETGQQLLPLNVQTAGLAAAGSPSIADRPYFKLYAGAPAAPPAIFILATALGTTTVLSECDLTHLGGCFQNALVWAFYPPGGSFDSIVALQGIISTKPPFGYFFIAQQEVATLSASSSATFMLASVDGINDYIFGPLDTALAALWWAIFGVWFFFHRARHIEI